MVGRVACIFALISSFMVNPARASTPPSHVFVLWLDGTTVQDWSQPGLPNFAAVLREGSIGVLSTAAGARSTDPRAMRARAIARFGAVSLTAALAGAGVNAEGIGDASESDGVDDIAHLMDAGLFLPRPDPTGTRSANVARADPNFPTARRTNLGVLEQRIAEVSTLAPVVFIDFGDTARAMRAFGPDAAGLAPWITLSMRRADILVGALRADMAPGDTLMIVSGTAPVARARAELHLGIAAIVGGGVPAGLLRSETTRRNGLIALQDLAPTILRAVGVRAPATMTGHAVSFVRARSAATTVRALERDLLRASRERRAMTRGTLGAWAALLVLAFLTVVAGRGRVHPRARIPRGWRDVLAVALIATAAAPLALYVENAASAHGPVAVAVSCVLLALGARIALGRERALAAVLLMTALVVAIDVMVGTPLGFRSPLAFRIASGGRAFGLSDAMLGVITGAALTGSALAHDRMRATPWSGIRFAIAAVGAGIVLSLPATGATLSAAIVLVPALGVVAARALGLRRARACIGIVAGTTLAIGVALAADGLRAASAPAAMAAHRLAAFERFATQSLWPVGVVVPAVLLGVLARQRRTLLDRAMWGRPHLRAAGSGAALAILAALVATDGGMIAAAFIALFTATGLLLSILEP